jgi:hypothetical protein
MKKIVGGRILNAAIRGATAAAVIRPGTSRRGSRGPLARADIRHEPDPTVHMGAPEVWISPPDGHARTATLLFRSVDPNGSRIRHHGVYGDVHESPMNRPSTVRTEGAVTSSMSAFGRGGDGMIKALAAVAAAIGALALGNGVAHADCQTQCYDSGNTGYHCVTTCN